MGLIASLFQIESLLMIFSGLAVFGTIVTITSPFFENDKLQARTKIVAIVPNTANPENIIRRDSI